MLILAPPTFSLLIISFCNHYLGPSSHYFMMKLLCHIIIQMILRLIYVIYFIYIILFHLICLHLILSPFNSLQVYLAITIFHYHTLLCKNPHLAPFAYRIRHRPSCWASEVLHHLALIIYSKSICYYIPK